MKPSYETGSLSFEELMQALAEDEPHRRLVLWICRQNDFQRRSLIRTQLHEMRLKCAPAALIALVEALENPDFARRAADFLADGGH
ncbi:hypothetical protein H5P28_09895 [Ruficoccus amylovorans]|uniref:Uncharacterized protein n=1 Tax=Ruficoccus amylovorans TaxID=1804625 RepID=A0A842HEC3_9BACT|nr:hypothetical protein [Ruficoccus amylovorans]MBC2594570.1 hypothetical protein [Ruficoccus amylovorans]